MNYILEEYRSILGVSLFHSFSHVFYFVEAVRQQANGLFLKLCAYGMLFFLHFSQSQFVSIHSYMQLCIFCNRGKDNLCVLDVCKNMTMTVFSYMYYIVFYIVGRCKLCVLSLLEWLGSYADKFYTNLLNRLALFYRYGKILMAVCYYSVDNTYFLLKQVCGHQIISMNLIFERLRVYISCNAQHAHSYGLCIYRNLQWEVYASISGISFSYVNYTKEYQFLSIGGV